MTNTIQTNSDFIWKTLLAVLFTAMITTNYDVALAVEDAKDDAIGKQLCEVVKQLSGGIARSIATIAIIGVAGGLLLGKLNWVAALTVSVGVIIIFSAGRIVSFISGDGGGISSDTDCSAM